MKSAIENRRGAPKDIPENGNVPPRRASKLARRMGICLLCLCLAPLALYAAAGFFPRPPLLDGMDYSRMILDSRGGILKLSLSGDHKYRLRTSLDAINPEARRAVLHYEDRYFYLHPGLNPFSIVRAAMGILDGQRRMGASTITMQVARLRYRLKTSHIMGKLRQIWLALLLERHYSKDEILEAYFNLAPYGGNVEGIEAASRIFFDKPASALTHLESHALAIVPQNPQARNPVRGEEFDQARRRLELELSPISQKDGSLARLRARSPEKLPFAAPHLAMELLGKGGNYVEVAGIEKDLQNMLDNALKSFVSRGKRFGVSNAAAILVDWESMRVCALAGSADFFNARISGQVDGTRARRSPGSTLKPFIYALALDQGLIHPMSMLADSPRSFGGYDPENFDRGFRGPLPAHEALKASRNLPAISLAEKLARPGLYGFLKNAGINFPRGPEYYGLALALGGAEISMRELAGLYAMLANNGLWRPLALRKNGENAPGRRLLSPEAAWLALNMLQREDELSERPSAAIYKTGTSNGFRDAWTAGIAGKYVLVVWVGDFNNQANPYFVGAETALPLFQEIIQALGSRRQLAPRAKEPPRELNLAQMAVCASTGDPAAGHCGETVETWIIPGISPTRDSGVLRPVLVDKASGLRACRPEAGKTEEIWMEFWPSEMLEIFASAGVSKPSPPEWMPGCGRSNPRGKPPSIILPKKNVVYQRRISEENFRLPLQASADRETAIIHWYAGTRYLGASRPGEIFFWSDPPPGAVEILAVDEFGGSAKRKCGIRTLP